MPKVTAPPLPASGLFGLIKPSGPTCMSLLNRMQPLLSKSKLFVDPEKVEQAKNAPKSRKRRKRGGDVKLGQGGTLDPLADGVIVVGVGKATKQLTRFLDCTKEYRTTCLLGCETDSYDSEGAKVRIAPWKHVTKELVEEALSQFTGQIKQTPPIFSALKMDGKALYEYARKGIPLPRPIEARDVTVHSLELVEWLGSSHSYSWPDKSLSEDEKKAVEKALQGVNEGVSLKDKPETSTETNSSDVIPSAFVLRMRVSGGTYVRSIVHDLANTLGSAGHVVTLQRSRQGQFVLEPEGDDDRSCIPWEVFEKALSDSGEVDEDGWTEWERQVLQHIEVVQ
ncbi:pseudouridine synthase [Dendrothele bispora CBS 962.96]|uniref:tRNA pseudouridine(55) synthase n=1 Tax=Dendrothele bispora (strain CBS 962.96) TaxID=1314807 RepID=A0A4S8LHA5_DENBC|nr:pseudouridine synthase [Dendrothele bispora CBS 962.96]